MTQQRDHRHLGDDTADRFCQATFPGHDGEERLCGEDAMPGSRFCRLHQHHDPEEGVPVAVSRLDASGATHDCPGGCGRPVPRHRFACRSCWHRLPIDLRCPITANYRRDLAAHAQAMTAARRWYRGQPRNGQTPAK